MLLEKLRAFEESHGTHLERFSVILDRHTTSLGALIDLFKYPVNSIEFAVEVKSLYEKIGDLLEDCKDNTADLLKDLESLRDVFEAFESEIENYQKKTKNDV